MWPHRRQPTRLPLPWDSPGKNTGVGCHFLLQCMKVKSESEVAQSCPTLRDPMDCRLPGSSIHGIFQARALEWGAIVFSKWVVRSVLTRFAFFVIKNNLWTYYDHGRKAVRKCERLWNEQKWLMGSFLVYFPKLYVSFIGFELIYSSLSCEKLIVMKMIIVHKI